VHMLEQLTDALRRFTESRKDQGPYMTAIEGMGILRSDNPKPPMHMITRPAICIVAQGGKWASFGRNRLHYRAGQALVVGVETLSIGRVFEASPEIPCLVLAMEFDLAVLREVAQSLDRLPDLRGRPGSGVLVADIRGPIADCALRLVRLLDTPQAIPIVHPLIMREMCYWLLTGPQGGEILRLAVASNPSQGLILAMHRLRIEFRKPIRIEDLAELAQMNPSTFHRQFKALTSTSPLQYQKELRLFEARRLMLSSAINAETAAFEVGYESSSQFSREYSRLFGASPKQDVQRARTPQPPAKAVRPLEANSATN